MDRKAAQRLALGDWTPNEKLVFRHILGGRPRDFIGTTCGALFLLSNRVIDLFINQKFIGWKTFPVEVYGKNGETVEGYHGFSVTGRCGPPVWPKEKIVCPPLVPNGPTYEAFVGMSFDPASWDGSDIFCPNETCWHIITPRVAELVKKTKFSNIECTPLVELEKPW
jgi:hypothetical protein